MRTEYGRLQWVMMQVCFRVWNAWTNGEGTKVGTGKSKTPHLDKEGEQLRIRLSLWWDELIEES